VGETFDELLCSSRLGVLKSDPERFFAATLHRQGMTAADALLVDDFASNCAAFEQWGGRAMHFTGVGAARAALSL
jgi:FMN phosphatase YigB (HAD superfamily)